MNSFLLHPLLPTEQLNVIYQPMRWCSPFTMHMYFSSSTLRAHLRRVLRHDCLSSSHDGSRSKTSLLLKNGRLKGWWCRPLVTAWEKAQTWCANCTHKERSLDKYYRYELQVSTSSVIKGACKSTRTIPRGLIMRQVFIILDILWPSKPRP